MKLYFIVLVLCAAVIRGNVLDLNTASIGKADVRNRFFRMENIFFDFCQKINITLNRWISFCH